MIKYQGIVTDRLNNESVKTRHYTTWGQAQAAAEKLSKKHFHESRSNIAVESIVNKKDRFYKSIAKML
jgi:hypothetical protein